MVLFQVIQFSRSTQFSSIWTINKIPSGARTTSWSEPGSDSNKGVVRILHISGVTGTSPSDCLLSCRTLDEGSPLWIGAVGVFNCLSWLGNGRSLDNLRRGMSIRNGWRERKWYIYIYIYIYRERERVRVRVRESEWERFRWLEPSAE